MTDYIKEMMETCKSYMYTYKCKRNVNGYKEYRCISRYEFFNHIPNVIEQGFKVIGVFKNLPNFTPSKQLEIIKLIGNKIGNIKYNNYEQPTFICENTYGKYIEVAGIDFSQALAQFTTELMKAGELDKEKVKEILS